MPRLSPALIHQARRIDPHLAHLLPACRDLSSAKLELQWLREHCLERITHTSSHPVDSAKAAAAAPSPPCQRTRQKQLLAKLVRARATGRPLQYVIGTEFFGDLEIRCREGVLIPRPETANWITCLAKRVSRSLCERIKHDSTSQSRSQSQSQSQPHLQIKILDLCTGTGCIPLLFHHILSQQVDPKHPITPDVRCLGIDISPAAIKLANHNLAEYLRSWKSKKTPANQSPPPRTQSHLPQLDFIQSDIFSPAFSSRLSAANCSTVDILVSNPPYISPTAFDHHQTARSVRKFEPKLALVPQPQPQPQPPRSTTEPDPQKHHSMGDTFYPRLLELGQKTDARIVALEASDEPQALRVAKLAERQNIWRGIEIWRDAIEEGIEGSKVVDYRKGIRVCGSGNGRVVVCWRGGGDGG